MSSNNDNITRGIASIRNVPISAVAVAEAEAAASLAEETTARAVARALALRAPTDALRNAAEEAEAASQQL
ncbi:hypothetical protein HAV15_009765 [Penicillium sp. str. |nr:hypothetical protein HAV15_009765 [Penicillium sp. str. \